jgi:hypothetical protein
MGRDYDHPQGGTPLLDLTQHLHPVDAWHLQVKEYQPGLLLVQLAQSLFAFTAVWTGIPIGFKDSDRVRRMFFSSSTMRIGFCFYVVLLSRAVYDGAMEASFWYPPHEQFLKRQTMIGETLKHRR